MVDVDALRGAVTRAVEKAAARGADAAEAFATETRAGSLKVERGAISRASTGRERGLAVRVVKDDRLGFAYVTDPEDAARAIDAALAAARVAPPLPGFAFPDGTDFPRVDGVHDARIAELTPEAAADATGVMLDAAKARAPDMTVTEGALSWGEDAVAIANSTGLEGAYSGTHAAAFLAGVLRAGSETTTGSEYAVSRAWDIDTATIGANAADLAMRSRDAVPLDASREMTVLFRPTAIDGLFDGLILRAVLAETAHAGRSVYSDRLGDAVLPDAFSLRDDGTHPGGWRSAPFDDEGVPARATPIVEKGRLTAYLDDVGGAAKRGTAATGSVIRAGRLDADRSFRAPPSATGLNLVLDGPVTPVDDLVRDVEHGVIVHDAMGAHTANAASGDFSVVSATLFLVEDGEVKGAAKPALLSGNLPRALREMRAMGDDARWATGGLGPAAFHVPTLRLDGLRVTPG